MDCMRLFTKEDVLDGDEKPVSHSSIWFLRDLSRKTPSPADPAQ